MSSVDNEYMIDAEIRQCIANAIRQYRFRRNITLAKAAKRIGVSISTFQKWENATHSPSKRHIYRIKMSYPTLAPILDSCQSAGPDSAN